MPMLDPFALKWNAGFFMFLSFHLSSMFVCYFSFPDLFARCFGISFAGLFRLGLRWYFSIIDWSLVPGCLSCEGPHSSPAGRGLELAGHQASMLLSWKDVGYLAHFWHSVVGSFHLFSAWLTQSWQIWELGVVKKLCRCVLSSDACQMPLDHWRASGCLVVACCKETARGQAGCLSTQRHRMHCRARRRRWKMYRFSAGLHSNVQLSRSLERGPYLELGITWNYTMLFRHICTVYVFQLWHELQFHWLEEQPIEASDGWYMMPLGVPKAIAGVGWVV